MEAIGAASAIMSLVEVTAEVLEAGYKYIRKVVKAPSEIKSLLGEVAGIYSLLDEIQNLHDDSTSVDQALTSLVRNGHLQACEESLNEAKQTIEKCTRVDGESMKNMGKRLAYPFKEDKILDLLAKLERNRKRLSEAINIDTRSGCRKKSLAHEANRLQSCCSTGRGSDRRDRLKVEWDPGRVSQPKALRLALSISGCVD